MSAARQEIPPSEPNIKPNINAFVTAGEKLQAVVVKMQQIPPDGVSMDEAESINKTLLEAMNELNAETLKFLNNSWRK